MKSSSSFLERWGCRRANCWLIPLREKLISPIEQPPMVWPGKDMCRLNARGRGQDYCLAFPRALGVPNSSRLNTPSSFPLRDHGHILARLHLCIRSIKESFDRNSFPSAFLLKSVGQAPRLSCVCPQLTLHLQTMSLLKAPLS